MKMIDCGPMIRERVAQYGVHAEGTSLYLLRAVEGTVFHLVTVCDYATAETNEARRLVSVLHKACAEAGGKEIDVDDKIAALFDASLDKLQELFAMMLSKKAAAFRDGNLKKSGHLDEVVEAYDRASICVRAFFDAISELQTVVMEHDASVSKVVGEFTDVDALMKAISS